MCTDAFLGIAMGSAVFNGSGKIMSSELTREFRDECASRMTGFSTNGGVFIVVDRR